MPSTPEVSSTSKGTPTIPESLAQQGAPLADTDACDLEKLLEEKRLELQKVTLAAASPTKDKGRSTETNSSKFYAEKSGSELNDEVSGSGGARVKVADLTFDPQTTDAPDAPDATAKKGPKNLHVHI